MDYTKQLILILPYIIAGMSGSLAGIHCLPEKSETRKKVLRNGKEFVKQLAERTQNSRWYRNGDMHLLRNGAEFHFWKQISWYSFWLLRVFSLLLGAIFFGCFGGWQALMGAVVLFYLPEWLLLYLNKKDNEEMLPEIKLLYHGLEIQIRAGVYVTEALAECYNCVQQKRLRQALLNLSGDIVIHADIYDALERFQNRFDNRHIDSLCIILLQALESGQAVELLRDLAEQMKDMEIVLLAGKREALARKLIFYQLGILAIVLGLVLYACVAQMLQAALHF